MIRRLSFLLGSATLAAGVFLMATPSVHAGGFKRGIAIQSPLDSPDANGPGSANGIPRHKPLFNPYYSPLIPISTRWRTTHLTPYYRGYCPNRHGGSYLVGDDGGPGCGGDDVGVGVGSFGPYTGAPQDETALLHLGGSGLVGYGIAPVPPPVPATPLPH